MARANFAARAIEPGESASEWRRAIEPGESASDWLRAHEALSRLAKERAAADAEEGRWLLAALRSATHVHLGFGSFGEYVERLFGYRPRSTQEKLRVAAALEQLPTIAQALAEGTLSWSASRELSRVAVAETEREWLEIARGKTVHQLEVLVAGKIPGDKPCSPGQTPGQTGARRHVLRFDVAPDTLALWREAMDQLRRSSNSPLDDDSALLLMARHILGGPRDEGRASYQIALCLCPECGQGCQQASGELVPIGAEVVAMAQCDGQRLDPLPSADSATTKAAGPANDSPDATGGRAINDSPNATGVRAVNDSPSATGGRAVNDSPSATGGRAVNDSPSATGGRAVNDSPSANHGSDARVSAREPTERNAGRRSAHVGVRAKQTIAPATRRAVRMRDQRRCVVPGCRNARFLDLHHIGLRSEGGGNEADNLVTLCGVHHRAVHRGTLRVSGRISTGVVFRHADGSDYGVVAKPPLVEALASTFVALRGLGFREGEIRQAQAEVTKSGDGQELNLERLLRDTLARLTRTHERR